MTKTKQKKDKIPKLTSLPSAKDFTFSMKTPVEFNPRNQKQKECFNSLENFAINFIIGKVGSGKTHIAVYKALQLLQESQVKKIVLLRPANTTKREHLGFLKGGLEEKVDPLILPMKNLIVEAVGELNYEKLVESKTVQPFALEYIEGLTYKNSAVIVDEFQNMDIETLRAIMTRIDDSSYLFILGDIEQIKLKNENDSSAHYIHLFTKSKLINITEFGDNDIVRGRITKEVERCFKEKDHYITSKEY